jgi:hypothetical protein
MFVRCVLLTSLVLKLGACSPKESQVLEARHRVPVKTLAPLCEPNADDTPLCDRSFLYGTVERLLPLAAPFESANCQLLNYGLQIDVRVDRSFTELWSAGDSVSVYFAESMVSSWQPRPIISSESIEWTKFDGADPISIGDQVAVEVLVTRGGVVSGVSLIDIPLRNSKFSIPPRNCGSRWRTFSSEEAFADEFASCEPVLAEYEVGTFASCADGHESAEHCVTDRDCLAGLRCHAGSCERQ